MKFTEGYWLRSEQAEAVYAMQAFRVSEIPAESVLAPGKAVTTRRDALDVPSLRLSLPRRLPTSLPFAHALRSFRRSGGQFETHHAPQDAVVKIDDEETVMTAGAVTVRVNRKSWGYQFEVDGKVITTCGFRNAGYVRWNRKRSTMLPGDQYLRGLQPLHGHGVIPPARRAGLWLGRTIHGIYQERTGRGDME